jgi:hypothetical protein
MENEEDIETFDCAGCSWQTTNEDDLAWVEELGGGACEDCRSWCEGCDSYVSNDNNMHEVQGSYWCDDCCENNANYCDDCNEWYDYNYVSFYRISDRERSVCSECASNNYNFCDSCDEYYDDECEGCGDGRGRGQTIYPYNFKPEPIFYGKSSNNLYIGLELETEIRAGSTLILESASVVKERVPEVYLKQDSSINSSGWDGYEIVSHPLSFNYWQNNMQHFWDTMDTLREDYKARSWDTQSCGIHIHLSRKGFKSGAHMHRWINFIYSNAVDVSKFAGRKGSRYAQFNDVYKYDDYGRPYYTLKDKVSSRSSFTERYSAVNTQNNYTLELRIFRGTTKPESIKAIIEFAHASVEYTRDLSLSDVKLGMLKWEWFCDYVGVNNGLYPNLYQKLSKLNGIDLNRHELLEA